jgi:hydroxymethylglutaryl-CoA reductase (NADPH)
MLGQQQLELVLEQMNNLNSTQLYVLTVTLMALAAFLVLSPAGVTIASSTTTTSKKNDTVNPEKKKKNLHLNTNATSPSLPTPAWYGYMRLINFVLMACFLASLVAFFSNASSSSESAPLLYRFLFGWSAYLAYFFSFSGVSLLYDLDDHSNDASERTTVSADAMLQQQQQQQHYSTKQIILPPACSATVCSDPSSFVKTVSSSSAPTTATLIDGEKEIILNDQQIADLVLNGQWKDHELEKKLADCARAVAVRRLVIGAKLRQIQSSSSHNNNNSSNSNNNNSGNALDLLPYQHPDVLDYSRVFGANCEIVVGYVPIPVGMVGPMTLNGQSVFIPMATTEGCLVASTNRGAKAITEGGGAHAVIVRDGITRAPCVRLPSARQAAALKLWCEEPEHFLLLKQAFESTTSFGKLKSCVPTVAGKNIYLRLTCFAGDAMGMNMVSKGSLAVIETLQQHFPDVVLVALSGNMCTDKKAAATNWIEGRGKSVVVEATIPKATVQRTLKTTVAAMVHTNIQKNLIGSAMAGTIGGFNAHASNMVTAVFLATGQDPAQKVESINCITLLEECLDTGDLWISCTMPSLEVGTVGGGTSLPAQAAYLKAIGCQGGGVTPGENARQLAWSSLPPPWRVSYPYWQPWRPTR